MKWYKAPLYLLVSPLVLAALMLNALVDAALEVSDWLKERRA